MIIAIDETKRIAGTERSWQLQRLRTRKGEPHWEPYKWCNSFCTALEEAVHGDVRLHPAHTLADAINAVSGIIRRYEELIPTKYRLA